MLFLDILQRLASVLGKLKVEPCRYVYSQPHAVSIFSALLHTQVIVSRAEPVNYELDSSALVGGASLRSIISDHHLLLILSVLNEDAGAHRVEVRRNKVVIEVAVTREVAPGKYVSSYHPEGVGVCVEDALVVN